MLETDISTFLPEPEFMQEDGYFCLFSKLHDHLFDATGEMKTFALLDASKVLFLHDRAEMSGLANACLYQGAAQEEYANVAPWLIKLAPEAKLTRELLSHSKTKPDQRHLLSSRAGIFIRSEKDLSDVVKHLRFYTKLREESGKGLFFRLQEPHFLDALLKASRTEEVARFFSIIRKVSYFRPSLTPDAWDLVTFHPPGELRFGTPQRGFIPQVDRRRRGALMTAMSERKARDLAISHSGEEQDRHKRYTTYKALFQAGFDNEDHFSDAHRVVSRLSDADRASFWNAVVSGAYSLRFILVRYTQHNVTEAPLK